MSKKTKFTFIDLFAGLGGFHLALTQLGGKCVFASELKSDLQQFYKINFPKTPICGDITKVKPSEIPAHDMLCGGFPCQPFSKAGKRQGFHDESGRGNLFYNICDIIEYHKPKYVLLENVQNLEGHDNGNTWNVIETTLKSLGYDVAKKILSPHEFGIPQHRKRIYIACARTDLGGLKNFSYPKPTNAPCNINSIVIPSETKVKKLSPIRHLRLEVWQEFIDHTIEAGDKIPQFPIWSMEFGATYDYKETAPSYQSVESLRGKKGAFGKTIVGNTLEECLACLPNYSQKSKTKKVPEWKQHFIEENRKFYNKHKKWLKPWMKKLQGFENSFMKMEWNCGYKCRFVLEDKIIQFRPSGIRVMSPTYSPALNLACTQIPVFPWVELPKDILEDGEPSKGRYMTLREAAKLQGMQDLKFDDPRNKLTTSRTYEALGNAVNVDVMKLVASKLLEV
jgi:DNA (cytosine-5)-methyltransferase 1